MLLPGYNYILIRNYMQ